MEIKKPFLIMKEMALGVKRCKVAGAFDPLVAVKIDPSRVKKYPVWKGSKNSEREGGNDGCQTDKNGADVKAGWAAYKRDMPQDWHIA
jgi:hypothetical protein